MYKKMDKRILSFGNIKIEKPEFYQRRNLILLHR